MTCIGGNDVANSFATSVGAKALTMRQVILIASICEFSGAMLLGSHVTETIKGGIIIGELFKDNPVELMYGMCTVLFGCAVWLIASTLWSLPVSSTHTCIGGMLGMAIVSKGIHSENWKTVINVICSWFYTPVIAGIISYLLFKLIRATILMKEKSFTYSLYFFSPMVAITLAINFFVVIYQGCPWLPFNFTIWQAAGVSVGVATVIGITIHFACVPCLRRRSLKAEEEKNSQIREALIPPPEDTAVVNVPESKPAGEKVESGVSGEAIESKPTEETRSASELPLSSEPTTVMNNTLKPVPAEKKTTKGDVFASLESDSKVAEIHKNAEEYDIKTEKVFVSLQILAAILNSFAHGANDVSHSIGPFAACIAIYSTGRVDDTSPSPPWVLAFGAVGIILGLAIMGYKVVATVGVNLVTVTPCRGFFIELAASFVVIVASRIGLPLSTTQCKIGAAVGVGLVGGSESVNWKLFLRIFLGWVATIFIAAIVSALLMVIGVWAFHLNYTCLFISFKSSVSESLFTKVVNCGN